MNKVTNIIIFALILLIVGSWVSSQTGSTKDTKIAYSEFMNKVTNGAINNLQISESERLITGTLSSGESFSTIMPYDPKLIDTLVARRVSFTVKQPEKGSIWTSILLNILPVLLFIGVWFYLMKQMQGGGKGGAMSFGKSRAKLLNQENNRITFNDVAGVEEAKEEVQELVDFLRDPSKFQKLGGRMPSGVLLTGNPGTGKTLLAKAIAGEAEVPFFSISGSDFVEMFVGVGAARVRDMFEQAKKSAPCIIFIDEIDAVGRQRGAGIGGGNDEREQTLNQLLVEMDGFEGGEGIIVVAATNRPDVLDSALMRPGRFDRQVNVPLPDIRGREQILQVHMKKIPVGKTVDASVIARGTPGFSGADLANLVNESALFAARTSKKLVEMEHFEFAKDKVMMGAERRSIVMPEKERLTTSYHESGHTVVGAVLKDIYDPVHKVTIIPRGRALGLTFYLPEEDRYGYSREYLLAGISVALGGRIAEEVFMKQMTTGASSDFQMATEMAQNMVAKWGMSDTLGTRIYGGSQQEGHYGGNTNAQMSDKTADLIDQEVSRILSEQYDRAKNILLENRTVVEMMTECLMEYETLDAQQIEQIMQGEKPTFAQLPTKKTKKKDDDTTTSGGKKTDNKASKAPIKDTPVNES